jgi:hypothetical protein
MFEDDTMYGEDERIYIDVYRWSKVDEALVYQCSRTDGCVYQSP